MTARRPSPYPPPPAGQPLPWRIRARSWWAGVGQPAWHRWARRLDMVMLIGGPALLMTALLIGLAQDQPARTAGTCTLIGQTWSCTR